MEQRKAEEFAGRNHYLHRERDTMAHDVFLPKLTQTMVKYLVYEYSYFHPLLVGVAVLVPGSGRCVPENMRTASDFVVE